MSSLQFTVGDPEAGWMVVTVRHREQEVVIDASYHYPSLYTMTHALLSLLTTQGGQVVAWTCEPVEYDMVFVRSGDTISLDILAFPDSRRSEFVRHTVLSASGTYGNICLPFWRGLRGLQGRFTAEELSERWQGQFPHLELKMLTAALGKGPKPHTV